MITMNSKCPRCLSSAFKPVGAMGCEFCWQFKMSGSHPQIPEDGFPPAESNVIQFDSGVREGTNRTTSGVIGQP